MTGVKPKEPVTLRSHGNGAMPAGHQVGDLFVAYVASSGYNASMNGSWTFLKRYSQSNGVRHQFYWKYCTSTTDERPTSNGDNWAVAAFTNGTANGAGLGAIGYLSDSEVNANGGYTPQATLEDNSGKSAVALLGMSVSHLNDPTVWTNQSTYFATLNNTNVTLTPFKDNGFTGMITAVFEIKSL